MACFEYLENFFILRGIHETVSINRIYGSTMSKRRYSITLWKTFTDCFNCLPVAAAIDERIMCMHGGLSPDLSQLDQINMLRRPTDVPDAGILSDCLWADPDKDIMGWGKNDRGIKSRSPLVQTSSSSFWLATTPAEHIKWWKTGASSFAKRKLVTLFAPNYCGEFGNAGTMTSVDENLVCSSQEAVITECGA